MWILVVLSYLTLLVSSFFLSLTLYKRISFKTAIFLAAMSVLSFYIGRSTFLIRIFDFEIILSYALVVIFTGSLLGGLYKRSFLCRKAA